MPSDLLSRPLIEIAADLREKRVTAWELTEAAIGRHERFGERLHAYSLWAPVQARAVAQAADAAFAGGVSVGPLQGLPVLIKGLAGGEIESGARLFPRPLTPVPNSGERVRGYERGGWITSYPGKAADAAAAPPV